MNALFYFSGYDRDQNCYWRFALTVLDGPHDRYAVAKDKLSDAYPQLRHWSGQFICLTTEDVFQEL